MLFDKPIQVHVGYKKDGLTVYFFDKYCEAYELVNNIQPCDVDFIKIYFDKQV